MKRTTEENGGRPLGKKQFESEAGITEYQWGKFWSRWSDVLHDAGYGPNKWNRAYKDSELLGKYAQLARELGRLPVKNDLRMKAHSDLGFPSPNTFSRFGRKVKIVKRRREYCCSQGTYDDVLKMCEEYIPRKENFIKEKCDCEETIGYVYLMKSGRFYKIGRSGAPGRRQYDLATQLPESVELIHKISTPAPNAAERYWHERFKTKRKGGEWFALNLADVKDFRRCKSM